MIRFLFTALLAISCSTNSSAADSVDTLRTRRIASTENVKILSSQLKAALELEHSDTFLESLSQIILKTSIYDFIDNGDINHAILYNVQSDTFIIFLLREDKIVSTGFASAKSINNGIFYTKDNENYIYSIIADRPAMYRSLISGLKTIEKPAVLFEKFLFDENEKKLIASNFVSAAKLIQHGSKDACRTYADSYLDRQFRKTYAENRKIDSTFYTSAGFTTSSERILLFADEETNRHVGMISFALDDETKCIPKTIITSEF